MKPAVFTAALLCSCLVATALAQQAPAERPAPPVNTPISAASLFKDAQALTASQQPDKAIAAWQQGLALTPTDANARLQLGNLLLQQRRASEAIAVLRPALQTSTDLPLFEALLAGLRTAGSPIDFAMSAEEALAKHPGNPGLLRTATEALLAVQATDRAWGYWQKQPPAEQNTALSQWLLGGILEAQTKPVLAWAAYTRAAPHEHRAKAALQRLSAQSLEISGERYFSPPPWTVLSLSVANASLLNPVNGVRADIALLRQTPSAQALQASLMQRLPLPPDDMQALLTQAQSIPQARVQLERLPCPDPAGALCVYVGAAATFAGQFPDVYVRVVPVGADALVVSIDNVPRTHALQALTALGQPTLLVKGRTP